MQAPVLAQWLPMIPGKARAQPRIVSHVCTTNALVLNDPHRRMYPSSPNTPISVNSARLFM